MTFNSNWIKLGKSLKLSNKIKKYSLLTIWTTENERWKERAELKTQVVQERLIERVRQLYKDVIPNELNIDRLFKTDKVSVVRWVDNSYL